MNGLERAALVVQLAEDLLRSGSWCGETHVQKGLYVLQELLKVPCGFNFILYKHGPFSFDLRDELVSMRADGLMELAARPYPYGPSLVPGKNSAALRDRYHSVLERYSKQLDFVAKHLGPKKVLELEQIATALYVTKELGASAKVNDRATRLNNLKPHVSVEQASSAVMDIDKMLGEARALSLA